MNLQLRADSKVMPGDGPGLKALAGPLELRGRHTLERPAPSRRRCEPRHVTKSIRQRHVGNGSHQDFGLLEGLISGLDFLPGDATRMRPLPARDDLGVGGGEQASRNERAPEPTLEPELVLDYVVGKIVGDEIGRPPYLVESAREQLNHHSIGTMEVRAVGTVPLLQEGDPGLSCPCLADARKLTGEPVA